MKELLESLKVKMSDVLDIIDDDCDQMQAFETRGLKSNMFSALYKSVYYFQDVLYLLMEAVDIIDRIDGRVITEENFFENTKANFVFMKELNNEDKIEWDYISYKSIFNMWGDYEGKSDEASSMYKYGEDEGGRYVIRASDHWSDRGDCNDVASCRWTLGADDKEKSIEIDKMLLNEKFLIGKAYFKDFENYIKAYPDYIDYIKINY